MGNSNSNYDYGKSTNFTFGQTFGSQPSYSFTSQEVNVFSGAKIDSGCANSIWKFSDGRSVGEWSTPNLDKFNINTPYANVSNLQQLYNFISNNGNNTSLLDSVTINFTFRFTADYGGYSQIFCYMTQSLNINIGSVYSNSIFTNNQEVNGFSVNTSFVSNGLTLKNYNSNRLVKLIAYCSGCCGFCDGGMSNMNLFVTAQGSVDMSRFCVNSNFDIPACLDYCNYPENTTTCFNNGLKYCFVEKSNGIVPILDNSSNCSNFFKFYLSDGDKASGQLDDKIKELCRIKQITPKNYTEDIKYRELCACHFDDEIYNNYYDSLVDQIPGLAFSGQSSTKCLFPLCNTSPFKSIEISGENNRCPQIQCIQGVSIENQGTIIGNIRINNNAECINLITNNSNNDVIRCNPTTTCPVNQVCNGGICIINREVNPPAPSISCSNDQDCSSNQICSNGTCVDKQITPTPSISCLDDQDCLSTQTCSNGTCVDKKSSLNLSLIIPLSIVGGIFLIIIIVIIIYLIFRRKKSYVK